MLTAALAAITLVSGGVLVGPAEADSSKKKPPSNLSMTSGYRKAVTVDAIRSHQAAFQSFADNGGTGNRVATSAANQASIDYVVEKAEAAGLDVTLDPFEFVFNADVTPAVMQRISPNPTTYVDGVDFASMTFSPNGDVTAGVQLPSGDNRGCEAADWAGFPAGSIALVQRGTPATFPVACTFAIKAQNAANAGAVGVIVFNNVPGTINGTLGGPVSFGVPVLGTSQAIGQEWSTQVGAGLTARIKVNRVNETRTSYNVIADTPGGNPDNVVVVGAHLDSVSRGPGINDNGSGSAALLAMAEALEGRAIANKVRFAWWNAEEFGLLGSAAYVAQLKAEQPAELADIALNLNFDMIGSPNYVRFVYDGDNSAFPVGTGVADGPDGSGLIEKVFYEFFGGVGLASEQTPFNGRSDYGPFIAEGIPAGGLFTGAEGVKTASQAELFGGVAGVAYDSCY
ncbi:MAG TPA: M28 family peptidase, partial [Nocardioidaceae bacterium]|nr:M28 family peptidase [Nocardioidaceae bacterium]